MDGAGFQGMPRFALTPAEEALVPRPHFSASQVASAVPSTYTRRGTSSASSSPLHSRHHRPQYQRKLDENNTITNHPYSSHRHGGGASSGNPLGLSVSFSSHSIQSQQQQQQPPSPSSPIGPLTVGLPSDTDEQEYPQNPKNNYHPSVPARAPSQGPPPRRSFSLTPRASRPVSPQNSDNNNSPAYTPSSSHAFLARGSLDSYPHRGSAVHLPQSHQISWDSSVRVDSPEPLTDSDDSYHASKDTPRQPRQSTNQGFFGGRRGSSVTQSNKIPAGGSSRISLESERPNRNSQDSPEGSSRPPRIKPHGQLDFSDEERQEPRRSRSGWRPSLSLIRQESSSFTMQVLPQPRRYLQNDQRRVSDMVPPDDLQPTKTRRRRKKTRKGSSRKRPREDHRGAYGHDADDIYALPDLFQILEKKTRHPLSYDDFEAFLRRQRAVEYLNFWTDVTAHEQLCRTFEVSERRFKREIQLEDRAFARERRRQNLDASLEAGRFSPDPGMGRATVLEDGHGLNNSNLYITSRSSLQLPLNDHLSFPLETRRYGLQDTSSPFPPMPPSLAQRRGSEQRPMGAYNRLLAGAGGRRTSLDRGHYSLDESPILEQEGDSSASALSAPRIRTRGSIDAFGKSRLVGRRPSETEDHIHHRALDRPAVSSPLNPTRPTLQEQSVQREMDQLAQAVEASIQFSLGQSHTDIELMPQESVQSLRIVEPILERKQSVVNFEGSHGPLSPPPAIRQSGESAYAPSVYSTIHDGRALLAQSYRTISVEDLEESVQRIYRKYLVQLRTLSMAAEEEAAAAAATKGANSTKPHETATRGSIDKSFAPGWDGYAEQVISEWNEKWRRRDSNARRARRTSARRSISGRGAVDSRYGANDGIRGGAAAAGGQINPVEKSADSKAALDQDSQDDSQDTERGPKNPKRPKLKRETTGTGITAFLSRLLRTETTVVELPTLTINTITVEEDYEYETDESEYDEDAEYDSDDEQEDDDVEENGGMKANQPRTSATKNVLQLEIKAPEPLFMKDRNQEPASPSTIADEHYTNTVNGSLAGDRAVSEAGTHDSAIPLQSLFARPSVDTQRRPLVPPFSTDPLAPAAAASRQMPLSALAQDAATTATATAATAPRPLISGSSAVATSAIAAAFYLPLECRQRVHAQVQQEGRTDAPHLFGPAKNFVVDVVLREHYYPLFLEYVKVQNLGLLHESHINNRIKRQGLVCLGVAT
ncbi:hypothetical protein BGX24_000058, partial [Mortierella sp. AD032]